MKSNSDVDRLQQLPDPPPRPDEAHKGTFGSVLLVAGSSGMSGAACLAGQAALHGGAGLVTVAIPRSVANIVAMAHSSYMTIALPDDSEGRLTPTAFARLEEVLTKQTCVAVGPGLGQSEGVTKFVQRIFRDCSLPLVLDADGLNAFAGQTTSIRDRVAKAPRILTPHPGEFSRLTGIDTATIQANREELAVSFARDQDVIVVLKGHRTIITDGSKLAFNTTGNTGLATGGTGDVLTGLIASLVAQSMDPFDATWLAAHLHGLAGESMAARHTDRFATSTDLLRYLDAAWKKIS